MRGLRQDLRHSLRLLVKYPGFSALAILILAVALGVNTAVFSLANGVLLEALPFREPDRLVDVSLRVPPSGDQPARTALLDARSLDAWQRQTRRLDGLAAYQRGWVTLTGQGEATRFQAARVSPQLFEVLGVPPAAGRTFDSSAEGGADPRAVVLSHRLWATRFRSDLTALGSKILLDGEPFTMRGVMPSSFYFPDRKVDLWIPLDLAPSQPSDPVGVSVAFFPAIARPAPGVGLGEAAEEGARVLETVAASVSEEERRPTGARLELTGLRDHMVAAVRPALLVIAATVGLVLLIACVNLAGLQLARGASRQREMAIRTALGCSRGRLVRQALVESLTLSLLGGGVGVLLAFGLQEALPRLLPRDLPRMENVQLDGRVLLFALLLSVVTALVFGLFPALRGSGRSLVHPLVGGGAGSGVQARRTRGGLVVAEVALAAVLLVAAGLLLRTLTHLLAVETGFDPRQVLAVDLDLQANRYPTQAGSEQFFSALLSRVEQHPAVQAAGLVSFPPFTQGFSMTSIGVPGEPPARRLAVPQSATPGYLRAMGMELAAGRWLIADDRDAPVAVVNESFVERYLPGSGGAVGRTIEVGSLRVGVVGVVRDVLLLGLDSESRPEVYLSPRLAPAVTGGAPRRLTLAVRTQGDPMDLVPFLRSVTRELDPDLPLADVRRLRDQVSASVAQPRFFAFLVGLFAAIALVLAAAGLYGVLAQAVTAQTRAIGVRRALGATARDILTLVLRQGLTPVLLGIAIGLVGALLSSRLLERMLFSIQPRDAVTFATVLLVLLAAALLACYVPARRAIRVDPADALRHE